MLKGQFQTTRMLLMSGATLTTSYSRLFPKRAKRCNG